MDKSALKALNSYSQVDLNAGVAGASPHRLITMLYDGAISAIVKAKVHMVRSEVEDIPEKGRLISRAIAIIEDGLITSLDMDVGGDLAQNLRSLYEYFAYRLVKANLDNDVAVLDEVVLRLTELRDAWSSIAPKYATQTDRNPNMSGAGSYGHV
ncbi:MAG: flagellar export chaperone FliS [Methylophilaceae bacterium]